MSILSGIMCREPEKEMSVHVIPYVVVCIVTVLLCCPLFYYCIVHSSVNIAQHSNNTALFTVH